MLAAAPGMPGLTLPPNSLYTSIASCTPSSMVGTSTISCGPCDSNINWFCLIHQEASIYDAKATATVSYLQQCDGCYQPSTNHQQMNLLCTCKSSGKRDGG